MNLAKHILVWVVGVLMGAIIGLLALRFSLTAGTMGLANGVWRTDASIGSNAANPLTRARIARIGLLALSKREAVYYIARTDSAGRPIKANATYRIQGHDLPARWWSLTAYNAQGYLIPNAAHAYSVTSARLGTNQGYFQIDLAPKRQGRRWVATGGGSQRISLVLRLYGPTAGVSEHVQAVNLPTITRVSGGPS